MGIVIGCVLFVIIILILLWGWSKYFRYNKFRGVAVRVNNDDNANVQLHLRNNEQKETGLTVEDDEDSLSI